LYFNNLFSDYKESCQYSVEKSTKFEKSITSSIDFLPPDLKQCYNESFKQIKLEIKTQNNDLVQMMCLRISSNPNELENYFECSLNASKNGQTTLHSKFIDQLDFIYA
jgi:hypothetical protein